MARNGWSESFRNRILAQFEPDISGHFVEFGKSLSDLRADYVIFMARKSLCLYDLLLRIGIPPIESCVLSDRALDLDLTKFAGKRVALVDDTLILGTTLAKTKAILVAAGAASVTVHVFCIDADNWCKDLVSPDSYSLKLESGRVMTFCANAVQALSLIPRPYISDFPISKVLKVKAADAQCFLSQRNWSGYNISTTLQKNNNVSSFSFFPTWMARADLEDRFGRGLLSLIDIVKVRGFARKQRDVYWLQLVPIAVLAPLHTVDLDNLFERTIANVPNLSRDLYEDIVTRASTPSARQRLLQYALAAIAGRAFAEDATSSMNRPFTLEYDQDEAERHFTPWLGRQLVALNKSDRVGSEGDGIPIRRATVRDDPPSFSSRTDSEASSEIASDNWNDLDNQIVPNLIPTFSDLFTELYDEKEIPFRRRAKELGVAIFEKAHDGARNRLESGMTWSSIVRRILTRHDLPESLEVQQVLSLVLDFCNDHGIAVPITCVSGGSVYRAYRHGEDVKFTGAEPALAFELFKGYMDAAGLREIPRLRLEKLLVLLIKIGLSKRFLEPLFLTASGMEDVLKIGFDLHGAIPMLHRGPRDRIDRDMWFSEYLEEKRVIRKTKSARFTLGKQVDGNFRNTTAPDDAFELGTILGHLSRISKDRPRPLPDQDITILASCGTPKHMAAALQAELDIFREWFDRRGEELLSSVDLGSAAAISSALKELLVSKGRFAVNSAKFKYVGYKTGRPAAVIAACSQFLHDDGSTVEKRKWDSYWRSARILEAHEEREVFDPVIDRAIQRIWECAAFIFAAEIGLRLGLAPLIWVEPRDAYLKGFTKVQEYDADLRKLGVVQPSIVARLLERLQELPKELLFPDIGGRILEFSVTSMRGRIEAIAQQIEVMNPLIEDFGRLFGRRDYEYMVYYDIMDSTANKLKTGDVDERRRWTRGLKSSIDRMIDRISRDAANRASEVFCWNGAADSSNDAKHIFVGGTDASALMNEVVRVLIDSLQAVVGQRLRIYVVPCGFVGSSAYRSEWDTEVRGDRFWEHWSRLSEAVKKLEMSFVGDEPILAVATEGLISNFSPPEGSRWISPKVVTIKTEIAKLYRDTPVKLGALAADRT